MKRNISQWARLLAFGLLFLPFTAFTGCGGSDDEISEEDINEFLEEIGANDGGSYYDDGSYYDEEEYY